MTDLAHATCPNTLCPDYAKVGAGNIALRGKYGKENKKELYYCRTCGKRFSYTRGSILFGAHLSKDKVLEIIHYYGEGLSLREIEKITGVSKNSVGAAVNKIIDECSKLGEELLRSLDMNDGQLDDLLRLILMFRKKRKKGRVKAKPPKT
ncbi:MAG: hypothetical protein LBE38_09495 [Deltaproteobacteria bacterium]|jgi:transposase-like protein|nr:hypothetical protein [Deltaproteobacteria bacterium]